MLSYQHAYHAGGPADLHKHLALVGLLDLLTRKPRGMSYMETHAGRGLYDLAGVEAKKTGEAAEGIERLDINAGRFADVLAAIRAAHGRTAYPGSPLIASQMLRPQDRLVLMELHPAEHGALKALFEGRAAEIHKRDGYEGVLALAPPAPRRGMVLVDPSYEVKTEYGGAAVFTKRLLAKWPEAVVMIWYPVLSAGRHSELVEGLGPAALRHEVRFDLKGGRGMQGSGLLFLNAPHGIEGVLAETVAIGAPVLHAVQD